MQKTVNFLSERIHKLNVLSWDFVGLTAYQFLLEKSIMKILFNFKVNFSLFNNGKTKSLIIPIYYM